MNRKFNPGVLTPEQAAPLLGIGADTLRYCLQIGYYGDIGHAVKTREDSESFVYEISKHKLYEYLGYDVTLSYEETLRLVNAGTPPWISQKEKDACRQTEASNEPL